MSHMYGTIDLTVTGRREVLNQVLPCIDKFECRDYYKGLVDEFKDEWKSALARTKPDEGGNLCVNISSFQENAAPWLQVIERIGWELEDLDIDLEAEVADSITDEDVSYNVWHRPQEEWKGDEGLFEMADSY